jgi:hypothetical protein
VSEGFKLDVPHSKDCWLRDDPEPFVCAAGNAWGRKKNGHRGGATHWFRFRCNCPACPAILLVRWDVLVRFINKGLAKP